MAYLSRGIVVRKSIISAALLGSILLLVSVPAQAIVPGMPQGVATPTFSIFGMNVVCTNSVGATTMFLFNYSLNDVAVANPSLNEIQVNPDDLFQYASIDPRSAVFIIGHECGHIHIPTSDESVADCFSATLGVQQGWFGPSDMPAMTVEWQNNPGNWSHPPGSVRLQNIQACMNAAALGSPLISTQ